MSTTDDRTEREFLRHTVATLAYRAGKVVRGASPTLADYRLGPGTRSAVEILAHMGDLFDWATSMATGKPHWKSATPQTWDTECARFFSALKAFDDALAADQPLAYETTRFFQGPVADALTHTGQIALLRRLHGEPIKGESFIQADIKAGRVGSDQTPPDPRFEFD
jgi:hypothetical protein